MTTILPPPPPPPPPPTTTTTTTMGSSSVGAASAQQAQKRQAESAAIEEERRSLTAQAKRAGEETGRRRYSLPSFDFSGAPYQGPPYPHVTYGLPLIRCVRSVAFGEARRRGDRPRRARAARVRVTEVPRGGPLVWHYLSYNVCLLQKWRMMLQNRLAAKPR